MVSSERLKKRSMLEMERTDAGPEVVRGTQA